MRKTGFLAMEDRGITMKKSPLAEVKERFGSKEALVKELKGWFATSSLFEDKLNADKGLLHVSNQKLLHLHKVATEVKERFTTRENLVNDLLRTMSRAKDSGLKAKIEQWSLPRLWDYYRSVSKKA